MARAERERLKAASRQRIDDARAFEQMLAELRESVPHPVCKRDEYCQAVVP